MSILKADDVCVCGHEYGDHKHKVPHACKEASLLRPRHDCSCDEFRLPASHERWDGGGGYTERIQLAAKSGVEQAEQRHLKNLDLAAGIWPGGESYSGMDLLE